jgi:hypothetical protein
MEPQPEAHTVVFRSAQGPARALPGRTVPAANAAWSRSSNRTRIRIAKLGFASVAHDPVIFDSRQRYCREYNRYLRERAELDWRPSSTFSLAYSLDDTCQQRTGRLEEDGCWPAFDVN